MINRTSYLDIIGKGLILVGLFSSAVSYGMLTLSCFRNNKASKKEERNEGPTVYIVKEVPKACFMTEVEPTRRMQELQQVVDQSRALHMQGVVLIQKVLRSCEEMARYQIVAQELNEFENNCYRFENNRYRMMLERLLFEYQNKQRELIQDQQEVEWKNLVDLYPKDEDDRYGFEMIGDQYQSFFTVKDEDHL